MLALGNDSAGLELMKHIKEYLNKKGLKYKDFGAFNDEPSNYPDFANHVTKAILNGECEKGILICGTGIGISMAANRHKGIRCALCHDVFSAKATRSHNDANVLAMGGRVIAFGHALEILEAFLNTEFSGEPRHQKRINMMG